MVNKKTSNTVKPVTVNKINKVNSKVVKVNINQVKPQVTFIKRIVSKYLITNKLQHSGNTTTKPQSIKLTPTQSSKLQVLITNSINGLVSGKYPHTTKPQLQYIKNHLNTHTSKYLV